MKSPLSKKRLVEDVSAAPMETPTLETARRTLKNAQEAVRDLEQKEEALLDQFMTATQDLEQARHDLGHAATTGHYHAGLPAGDSTPFLERVKHTESRVFTLDIGLKTLRNALQTARGDVAAAEKTCKRETLRRHLQELNDAGREVDQAIDAMAGTMRVWLSLAAVIREECDNGDLHGRLKNAVDTFRPKLLDHCGAPACRTGLEVFLGSEKWSACLPSPDEADRFVR